jgi:formylglycine-generating enzyme required for sulfatase activity
VPDPPKPSPLATALHKAIGSKPLRLTVLIVAAVGGIIATGLIIKKVIQREDGVGPPPVIPTTRIAHTQPIRPIGTKPATASRPTVPATKPETTPTTGTAPATQTVPATQTQPITRPVTVPATKPTTKGVALPPLPDREYAKTFTLNIGNRIPLKLLLIRAGKLVMGSPSDQLERKKDEPRHSVAITRHFYLAEVEVTREQYKAAIDGKVPADLEDPEDPVTHVSWHDAVAFCKKLSKQTGRMVRLPTEAQWEYACRAGTNTAFNTGDKFTRKNANFNGKYIYGLGDLTLQETTPWPVKLMAVRNFKPNPWGLYDMHGNVAEWCRDWYGPYRFEKDDPQKQVKDPAGPPQGTKRILRGGAWRTKPTTCRSAAREAALPEDKADDIGLRIIIEVELRDAVD